MSDDTNLTWVNGDLADTISVHDRGFQFGDGLFETMRIVNGKAKDLGLHLARMKAGAARLKIPFPQHWQDEINTACAQNTQGVCKLILTRGLSGAGLKLPENSAPTRIVKITTLPSHIAHLQKTGIALQLCDTTLSCNPAIFGLKMLSWLEPALANLELTEGVHEGLMCNDKGHIIEGTTSNFFAFKNEVLITPDLSACGLSGITRAQVIIQAESLGWVVEERAILPSELPEFDACFVTNSVANIYPVTSITFAGVSHSYVIPDRLRILQNN